MDLIFPENKIPEKARLNRFARHPIIFGALVKTLFGANPFDVNDAIEHYDFGIDKSNHIQVMKLKLKMVYYRYAYEFKYNEFASYNFEHKNKKECLKFVGVYEYLRVHNELTKNDEQASKIFSDKRETYKRYKDYYKRDIAVIKSPEDLQSFLQFTALHPKFILKRATSNNGAGISFVDTSQENAIAVFKKCLKTGGAVAEEIINQIGIVHDIFPKAVNTVRFVTYYENNKLTNIVAVFRFGTGKATVDNATQGGLYANINLKTGIITSDARVGFKSDVYQKHPDSNMTIKGIQMPDWNELLKTIETIVKVSPQIKYVGWDFAYSDKGWVLVEGNGYPGIYMPQNASQTGLREIFSKTYFTQSKDCKKYSKGIY